MEDSDVARVCVVCKEEKYENEELHEVQAKGI